MNFLFHIFFTNIHDTFKRMLKIKLIYDSECVIKSNRKNGLGPNSTSALECKSIIGLIMIHGSRWQACWASLTNFELWYNQARVYFYLFIYFGQDIFYK